MAGRPYLAPALGLLALLAAAWGFAWLDQPGPPPAPTAAGLIASCEGPVVEACIEAGLDEVLREEGQDAAFALLAEIVAQPRFAGNDHQFAHHLGRTAQVEAGVAEALAACPRTMGAGCVHGVLESFFQEQGPDAPLAGTCAGGPGTSGLHQCWHGIGHGLMMAFEYDWRAASARCPAAPDFDSRVACNGGVFMENLMGARVQQTAALEVLEGGGDPAGLLVDRDRIRPDEPDFPCREANGTEAAIGCWQFQPWVVLEVTGTLDAGFDACELAGRYALACDRGMGQVASAQARVDGSDPLGVCAGAANDSAVGHCRFGVVMESMNHVGDVGPGIALCLEADQDFRADCFEAVGTYHIAVEADPEVRWGRCAEVPEHDRFSCAGIRRSA